MHTDAANPAHHSPPALDWHVLGAGAIGGLIAAHLERQGQPTGLILASAAARAAYPRAGLTVSPPEPCRHPWRARPAPLLAGELSRHSIRRLLIATKAHQTLGALAPLLPALAPDALVVLLQNGMGVMERLRSLLPPPMQLVQGTTTEGVWRRSRFELVHAGRGQTLLGPARASWRAVDTVVHCWAKANLTTRFEAAIEAPLWRKLAINCAINPYTALLQCRNGELPDHPEWRAGHGQVLAELTALLQARGRPAELLAGIEEELRGVIAATAANHSSMLQDLRRGAVTEMDHLNGYVVRQARRLGLQVPENQRLARAIQRLSTGEPERPEP